MGLRKKIMSWALALTLALGCVPATAFAETGRLFNEALPLSGIAATADNTSADPGEADEKPHKEGQVIIVMEEDANDGDLAAVADGAESVSAVAEEIDAPLAATVAVADVADGADIDEAIAELQADERVAYAQPNYVYSLPKTSYGIAEEESVASVAGAAKEAAPAAIMPLALSPSASMVSDDPDRSQQWYLDSIRAYEAWSVARCEGKVTVAVIDSGIAMDHPDLRDNIVAPYDVVGDNRTDDSPSVPDSSPDDTLGHGTHVAGIACGRADNGLGIAGVSYNANVMPIKVFYTSTSAGGDVCETKDLLSAYNYILGDNGLGDGRTMAQTYNVRVINMSLGDEWYEGETSASDIAVLDAIDTAEAAGILTVCAAGNDEHPIPYKNWPSDYENCISVIALSSDTSRASFSNYGPEKDIAAPGANIYSTVPASTGYDYVFQNGTSMASPVVSGASALLWAANPALTPAQVKNILFSTAADLGLPGRDSDYGYGRLDAYGAVVAAQGISVVPVTDLIGFPTRAEVGVPLALYGKAVPDEANQSIVFTIKDPGTTGAAISGGTLLASNAGTVTVRATVIGGAADGGNFIKEFTVTVEPSDSSVWNGLAETSWYDPAGTEFEISTPQQLAGLAAIANGTAPGIERDCFTGKTIRLTRDIYLNTASVDHRTSGMRQWTPIGDINNRGADETEIFFDGLFDGQGHSICNIYIDGVQTSEEYGGYQGLFGALGQNAVVTNTAMDGGWIFGRSAGSVAAVSHVSSADRVPQIVGCRADVTIEGYGSGSRGVGGIFGGENQAGGHSGTSESGYRGACIISNCYNLGTVRGYLGSPAGGIAGIGSVVMTGCYNAGSVVSQGTYIGSLMGMLLKEGCVTIPSAATGFSARGTISASYGLAGTCPNLYRYQDGAHHSNDDAAAVDTFLSQQELMAAAPLLGSAYVQREDGYPALYWESGSLDTVDISNATVDPIVDQLYTGEPIVPAVRVTVASPEGAVVLTEGSDYHVSAANNVETGTATITITGVGRYSGAIRTEFSIVTIDLSQCDVDSSAAQWYYGDDVNPSITVKSPAGTRLRAGRDYTVSVTTDGQSGIALITLTGNGVGVTGTVQRRAVLLEASDHLNGSGSAEDPYLIASKSDLQYLAHEINGGNDTMAQASYRLTADIDASATAESPLAVDPIGSGVGIGFSGSFDGDGHSITLGLNPDTVSAEVGFDPDFRPLGLFGSLRNGQDSNAVRIENLTIKGSAASSGDIGAFAGAVLADTAIFSQCINEASVECTSDAAAGGFCAYTGQNTALTMDGCINRGSVEGGYHGAGLVAEVFGKGAIAFTGCRNEGAIEPIGHGGGIAASFSPTEDNVLIIEGCANTGSIKADGASGISCAGGLLGYAAPSSNPGFARATIARSWNSGPIQAGYGTGGIVGRIYYLPVDFSAVYNTGSVTNSNIDAIDIAARAGGIVGMVAYDSDWTFNSVYNAGELACASGNTAGGLVGYAFYDTVMAFDHAVYTAESASRAVGELSTLTANPVVNGQAVSMARPNLASMDEAALLNELGAAFSPDSASAPANGGLPVLFSGESHPLNDAMASAVAPQPYTGLPVEPRPILADGDYALVRGADYLIEYHDNLEQGEAKAVITGAGRYSGTIELPFAITKGSLVSCTIAPIPDQLLTEGMAQPALTVRNAAGVVLQEGTDYTVSYSGNGAVGTATATITGIGNYEGTATAAFRIVNQKQLRADHISAISSREYTGAAIEPSPTVIIDGIALVKGVDYTLSYRDNVSVGQATVTVTGMGGYVGAHNVTFDIVPASLAAARIDPIANQTYTGTEIRPAVNVTLNGRQLAANDFDVAYANNIAVGQAAVTVTGKGNYTGSRSGTFLIIPAAEPEPPAPGPGGDEPSPPADTVLSVYTQEGNDASTKALAASFTRAQLEAMARPVSNGGYLYSSDGRISVIAAKQAVTMDQLLRSAGVSFTAGDSVTVADPIAAKKTASYEELQESRYFFPAHSSLGANTGGKTEIPAAIALSWNSTAISSTAAQAFQQGMASSANQTMLRFIMGVSEADYAAGEYAGARFIYNVDTVTVLKDVTASGSEGTNGGGSGEEGGDGEGDPIEDPDNPLVPGTMDFPDVGKDAWYYNELAHMYNRGIIRGDGATGLFNPYASCTRAQMAAMLYRLEGQPAVENSSGFPDVPEGSYFADAVAWARQQGIVGGDGNTGMYLPYNTVTRQQLTAMLHRYAQWKALPTGESGNSGNLSAFTDSDDIQAYARDAMAWAVGCNILRGDNGRLLPRNDCTRAQIVVMLHRFAETIPADEETPAEDGSADAESPAQAPVSGAQERAA